MMVEINVKSRAITVTTLRPQGDLKACHKFGRFAFLETANSEMLQPGLPINHLTEEKENEITQVRYSVGR